MPYVQIGLMITTYVCKTFVSYCQFGVSSNQPIHFFFAFIFVNLQTFLSDVTFLVRTQGAYPGILLNTFAETTCWFSDTWMYSFLRNANFACTDPLKSRRPVVGSIIFYFFYFFTFSNICSFSFFFKYWWENICATSSFRYHCFGKDQRNDLE